MGPLKAKVFAAMKSGQPIDNLDCLAIYVRLASSFLTFHIQLHPRKASLEMIRPGKQTMSSSSESLDVCSLDEVESRGGQSLVVLGEVPKRPKRPTVLSPGEDPGRRPAEVVTDQAYYNTREDVRKEKKVSQAQSLYSREDTASEEYVEYMSSDQDEGQTQSQPSQRSTDCSKSFSQIYSEIFEESKERQQKAERACRAYHINRAKLHGRSRSRGRESGTYSSMGSEYSSDLRKRCEEYDNPSVDSISEEQPRHNAGYQKNTSLKSIRSSFKKLPVSEIEDVRLRGSLKRSECSGRELESKKKNKEFYGDSSANRYRSIPSLSPRKSSVCSRSNAYSRPRKHTDSPDYLTDCRRVSGTGTSPRRSPRDYHPGSSTRHSHHYYRRLASVPKTYQDRGNSPINIKTRRQTNEPQSLHADLDTEGGRAGSFRRASVSVGVQYPSDDEGQDSYIPAIKLAQAEQSSRRTYYKENVVLNFTQLVRNVYDEDREMTDTSYLRIGVTSEEEVPGQPSQYGHSNPVGFNTEEELTDAYSQDITSHLEPRSYDVQSNYTYEYEGIVNRSEITNDLDQIDVEAVEELTDDQRPGYEEEEGLLSDPQRVHKSSDDESKLTTDSLENQPRSSLSLKIYNADEALMEIPEGFTGSAVILDDDADFLDITLTDDEEHIRAKLMAAALTTRTSNPSSSVNTSRKSRRSTDSTSSILSYKPSVIFSRRSEATEDEAPPQESDRISLLAERVLRACANPYTETSKWEPLATPKAKWQPFEEGDFSKLTASILNDSENPLDGALQLLSKEFNRKLQRQIKEIAESFH